MPSTPSQWMLMSLLLLRAVQAEYQPQGCYELDVCSPDASGLMRMETSNRIDGLTQYKCARVCHEALGRFGNVQAALRNGKECWCTDRDWTTELAAKEVEQSKCNAACPGDAQDCGGSSTFTVLKIDSQPWNGHYDTRCYGPIVDLEDGNRTIGGQFIFSAMYWFEGIVSPESCARECQDASFAAVSGDQCSCGYSGALEKTALLDMSQCDIACAGDSSQMCASPPHALVVHVDVPYPLWNWQTGELDLEFSPLPAGSHASSAWFSSSRARCDSASTNSTDSTNPASGCSNQTMTVTTTLSPATIYAPAETHTEYSTETSTATSVQTVTATERLPPQTTTVHEMGTTVIYMTATVTRPEITEVTVYSTDTITTTEIPEAQTVTTILTVTETPAPSTTSVTIHVTQTTTQTTTQTLTPSTISITVYITQTTTQTLPASTATITSISKTTETVRQTSTITSTTTTTTASVSTLTVTKRARHTRTETVTRTATTTVTTEKPCKKP